MLYGRRLLIYLAILYEGNYHKIVEALQTNKYPIIEEIENKIDNLNCKVITYIDPDFPQCFKRLNFIPFVIFYLGNITLLDQDQTSKNVAIIGTRHPTDYGIEATQKIVETLAKRANIVSGLAYGIDAIAHQEALMNGGKCIAVLGSGIDIIYPPENENLYRAILNNGGLIISEYPPGTVPVPENFPFRNRLIAGASRGILVTEAYEKSGTSITVNFALMFNKEVFAVPYPYNVEDSFCNRIINQGAVLVRNGNDIIQYLNLDKDG